MRLRDDQGIYFFERSLRARAITAGVFIAFAAAAVIVWAVRL